MIVFWYCGGCWYCGGRWLVVLKTVGLRERKRKGERERERENK